MRPAPSPHSRIGTPARHTAAAALVVLGALVALAVLAGPARARSFSDVTAGHPDAAAISAVAEAGVMTGYADGTFRPDLPVTRQQFAKMIVLALDLSVSEADHSPFADVAPSSGPDPLYPDHYVAVAASNGITTGITPTSFGPWRSIARAQLITMVVRGVGTVSAARLASPPSGYLPAWPTGFSPQHGENARKAQFNGFLAGLPLSTLGPWAPMSRGEAANVLRNVLESLAAEPGGRLGPTVAYQPSHQDDTGAPDWHEYVVCGDIARRTIALLATSPVAGVLAWETGMGLTGSNNDGSNARAFDSEIAKANAAGADYFISIHNDGSAPSGVLGMYFSGDAGSEAVAEIFARTVSAKTGLPYRGTRGSPLYSLDPVRNHAPVRILLEIGDNVRDRAYLESENGRVTIAGALAGQVSLLADSD